MKDTTALALGIVATLLFTAAIALLGPLLTHVPHLPDQGASWYYWKLIAPTWKTRLSAWGGYTLHQLGFWWLIWRGRSTRRYAGTLQPLNVAALAFNGTFCALHLLQSHLFYDGLAQDVSIWSALGSVAFLLIWVLLMENDRRGLFFGKRLPLSKAIIGFARQYHGYVFAWAIVYTFWYHPTEGTFGHLVGFFYIVLIMLQGSLMYTRVHLNRYWTFTLEFLVLIHGTAVAAMQGGTLWPMFFFGFGGIFVITQMFGLGLSRAVRIAIAVAYVGGVAAVYAWLGWARSNEIVRIPFIDYVSVFVLAGLIALGLKIRSLVWTSPSSPEPPRA